MERTQDAAKMRRQGASGSGASSAMKSLERGKKHSGLGIQTGADCLSKIGLGSALVRMSVPHICHV